jgi:Acyltransferase
VLVTYGPARLDRGQMRLKSGNSSAQVLAGPGTRTEPDRAVRRWGSLAVVRRRTAGSMRQTVPLGRVVGIRHALERAGHGRPDRLGPAMRAIGMIEVDRDSPDFGQIDQAAARSQAAGHSLLVSLEGTTSPDGTIGQFKDGAFIIAITSQAPVLPVTVEAPVAWPPGRTAIHSGQVRVVIANPLATSGLTHHHVPGLRDQTRNVICSSYHALDPTMQAKAINRGDACPALLAPRILIFGTVLHHALPE